MPKTSKSTKRQTPLPKSGPAQAKVSKVMTEFKHGSLHSGSKRGPTVHGRKQAIAVALAEARKRQGKK